MSEDVKTIPVEVLLTEAFNKIHVQLSLIAEYTEGMDEEITQLVTDMEFGALAPMRKLRVRLSVPFGREVAK